VPTYQYACTVCDERTEVVQSFTDAPLTECAACQGNLRKVFSAVGVVFKGSGFYKNDSREPVKSTAKNEPAAAGSSEGGASSSGDAKGGDAKGGDAKGGDAKSGAGKDKGSGDGPGKPGGTPSQSKPSTGGGRGGNQPAGSRSGSPSATTGGKPAARKSA
jgi:putative FmdB family regulatory protein